MLKFLLLKAMLIYSYSNFRKSYTPPAARIRVKIFLVCNNVFVWEIFCSIVSLKAGRGISLNVLRDIDSDFSL
jgi:hypothetical protein